MLLHLSKIGATAAVRAHGVSLSVLGHFHFEAGIVLERDLHVELLLSVDWVVGAWTVDAIQLLLGNLEAIATSVAIAEVALSVWSITLVCGAVPRPGVGLHDVELWAPLTADHVGIAVVVSARTWIWITVDVDTWHRDQIESSTATASSL